MTNTKNHDLMITGLGNSAGGTFARVYISGKGEVNGDIESTSFQCDGLGDVFGNLKTGTGRVNGKALLNGNVEADRFTINGHTDINGNFIVKRAEVNGLVGIKGNIVTEEINIRGAAKASGDCTAESFISKGSFNIAGLINAGTIEIELCAGCKVKEIGGEKINIKRGNLSALKKIIQSLLPVLNISNELEVETIEGDDIYIENTKAKAVRGNNVTLGPGCEIDLVEYRGQFTQDKEAQVRESKHV